MLDQSEQIESPDWPVELAEPVARLGPPRDVYRIPRRYSARKTLSGLILIIGGLIGNYLYWIVFKAQFGEIHFLYFLLFGPILTGIGLIYAAWRDRGLWILIYPMGLLRWQRGEVVTFPWDEIAELSFFRVVECERPRRTTGSDGEMVSSWLPIAKMGSKSLGAHIVLRRDDGAEAILPSSLHEFKRLSQVVQEETFMVMWPKAWSRFLEGKRVKFGDLSISLGGLHRDGSFLAWHEIEDTLIKNGKVIIRSRLQHRSWLELPLHLVVNPHVFVALLITGPPLIPEVEEV